MFKNDPASRSTTLISCENGHRGDGDVLVQPDQTA